MQPDHQLIIGTGSFAGFPLTVRWCVDDGVLGKRDLHDPKLLSAEEITTFETRFEVLGWVSGTQ